MKFKISTFMLVVYLSAIASASAGANAGAEKISARSYFSPVPYVDLALGMGIHKLDRSDNSSENYEEEDQGAVSRLIKLGLGVQWFPFLSTQVGIWTWNSDQQSKRMPEDDAEYQRVGLFDGVSSSMEIALQWPVDNPGSKLTAGPYYRYGRHCWSAVLTGLLRPWSKEGCSNLNSMGYTFPLHSEETSAVYVEFTRTDFDDLSSNSLQFGAKLAF
jgi:hypothetical protein